MNPNASKIGYPPFQAGNGGSNPPGDTANAADFLGDEGGNRGHWQSSASPRFHHGDGASGKTNARAVPKRLPAINPTGPRKRGINHAAPPLVVRPIAIRGSREALLSAAAPRFDAKWVLSESGCWLWTGAKSGGYGDFRVGAGGSKIERAHRVSYELRVGPIPEGLTLDHLCNTPKCVNPTHLEPASMRENTFRAVVRRGGYKTFCPRGHEKTGTNTVGNLFCRVCGRARVNKRYRERMAEVAR